MAPRKAGARGRVRHADPPSRPSSPESSPELVDRPRMSEDDEREPERQRQRRSDAHDEVTFACNEDDDPAEQSWCSKMHRYLRAARAGPGLVDSPGGHGKGQGRGMAGQAAAGAHPDAAAAFMSTRWRTVVMFNIVQIWESMDECLVSALSRPLGCAFRAGPHQLGLVTYARAVVQALASPLGGLVGHYFDRVTVLFAGCLMWGFFCTAFAQGITAWAFNGLGLALIIPNIQSLIADYHSATQRGLAFGTAMLTGAIGALGAPLVGLAAERWFGFKGVAGGEEACQLTAAVVPADLPKARALGSAMLLFTVAPWALCVLFYSGLHWSYPRDNARSLKPKPMVVEVFGGGAGSGLHRRSSSGTLD
ncbi:hypothetical protein TSOC_002813 [Tetrabaena socialis]|uniref:Major facilitator superfamily (MFS) profile domain-containing protein n=1 Tax=Tetrabaena socialis TaxID=47790 RepID=A0A2J8AD99_9CHLO|nr:hypothetical protein TSOC_002813 [Tetrabaena socialis]|eukprot:PNH10483.1 hypothetical protein TSOC_002813 [Tetrabaena socialis]